MSSLSVLRQQLADDKLALLYISRPSCSVCHAVLPQVEQLLTRYPRVQAYHVNADEMPEIAGEFSVFTIPAVIFFANGKEMFRKARFIPMDELDCQIQKISSFL
ncbi:thioredoxin family protein [Bacillus xiapuensis]|uniref:thioredoxin family protein n=1 Tax=Bacillus xiapuensis TaxID=2014075 RepID=UPI000C239794|nr:thioredoxin family protein [Bacillus xiapuensis]